MTWLNPGVLTWRIRANATLLVDPSRAVADAMRGQKKERTVRTKLIDVSGERVTRHAARILLDLMSA